MNLRAFGVPQLTAVLLALCALPAHAISASADKEIRQLLNFVGHSPCTFIRSGTPYSATAAQEHLTMKYGKAQSKISSSEDFIAEVASKSYLTGQPYTVQCPKVAEQPAKSWLEAELKRLRAEKKIMQDKLELALQNASSHTNIPTEADLNRWVGAALQDPDQQVEITLRFVDATEGRELNRDYRDKDYATNVLTFTFDDDMPQIDGLPLMGDLVFCCEVVEREAIEQNKPLMAHYCHMVVHGTLHLQGFDHIIDAEAETMESLETQIVTSLGYDDPYLSEKS